MSRPELPTRARRTATALLCVVLAGAGAAAADDRFARALAAYDEAVASRDGEHEGYARAYALWQELADEGDVRARYHIGMLNLFGLGGAEFDQHVGVVNVRAAAEAGYPVAQSFMGFLVENSDGVMVETGDDVALAWWRKGADGNHCTAVRRLARAYGNGELGLQADPAEAAAWQARLGGCDRR